MSTTKSPPGYGSKPLPYPSKSPKPFSSAKTSRRSVLTCFDPQPGVNHQKSLLAQALQQQQLQAKSELGVTLFYIPVRATPENKSF